MEKTYHPETIEAQCHTLWEHAGLFKANPQKGAPYCIVLPPPNVTGTLHMGHGFQVTLMDALIRYHRMQGFKTHWQAGLDHAGIATQMVVERQLTKEKSSRQALGREAFVQRVWHWKARSGGTIKHQLLRMGASLDWSRERFSLDETISKAVHEAFIKLYEEGLIYRGKRLVNWDTKLQTAISDLEVITQEEDGELFHIRYPLAKGEGELVVATTRPETLFGDTAVAVHPDDERYQALVGQHLRLPLTDKLIPIVADNYVDCAFGTGCVKITPAHDFNDYDVGTRHKLPIINILTPDGRLNDNAPQDFQGLTRSEARTHVIKALKKQALLVKVEKYRHAVPRGDRSGEVIEPYLTHQWFLKTRALAEPAIEAVKSGAIQFTPSHWTKIYYQWLEDIEDWCISRQLWWGHRIPAWYDDKGNTYVGRDQNEVRTKYQLEDTLSLTQDNDVLDTWFSSALWPFATLGWPEHTPEMDLFYPTSVLVTGFDIIFFWVARMVMMGLKFTSNVPFRHVYITGLIRDSEGQKMSKSKGNVLDPIDLIDGIELSQLLKKRTQGLMQPQQAKHIKRTTEREYPEGIKAYGTDALRFTYCALATLGRDIRFDLGRIEGYRNFCNKLWNAARFVLITLENQSIPLNQGDVTLSISDRWIKSQLRKTIAGAVKHFNDYRFDLLTQTLYDFVWNAYCDWYLEIVKAQLKDTNDESKVRGTCQTLVEVLDNVLRLLHPLMPFITEALWQALKQYVEPNTNSLLQRSYPKSDEQHPDENAEQALAWCQHVVLAIRNLRGELGLPPNKPLNVLFQKGNANDKDYAKQMSPLIISLARLNSLEWLSNNAASPLSATALIGSLEVHIPMAGLIDKASELKRLHKELIKIEKERLRAQQKLANPHYISKAPEAVVEKTRQQLIQWEHTADQLKAQIKRTEAL